MIGVLLVYDHSIRYYSPYSIGVNSLIVKNGGGTPKKGGDYVLGVKDNQPTVRQKWGDLPASFHNGACGFSFADGYSEIHKWRSWVTTQPVRLSSGFQAFPFSSDANAKQDANWITFHTSVPK
jgi:hypothetical protein